MIDDILRLTTGDKVLHLTMLGDSPHIRPVTILRTYANWKGDIVIDTEEYEGYIIPNNVFTLNEIKTMLS